MDDDGLPEVLAGNRNTSSVEIWTYDRNLDELVFLNSIGFPYHIHDIKAADFDNDGDIDIVVGLRSEGLYFATNTGSPGTFEDWSVRELNGTYSWQVLVEDFDGDGNLDILDAVDGGPIHMFYGDGNADFVQGNSVSDPDTGMRQPIGFNAVDINGDSRLDLIGMDGAYLRVFLNPGDRESDWASIGPTTAFGDPENDPIRSHISPSAADLDNDGFVEQVAYWSDLTDGSFEVVIFKGYRIGSDLLWDRITVAAGQNMGIPELAGVADLNGDGHLDIHVGGGSSFNGLLVYLGDGAGHFMPAPIPLDHGVGGFNSLVVTDLNDDGGQEIIASRFNSSGLEYDGFEILSGFTIPAMDAKNIEFVGQIGSSVNVVAVQEDFAYVGEESRLTIVRTANSSYPFEEGELSFGSDEIQDLAVFHKYAYVLTENSLRIVNVANEYDPFEMGSVPIPGKARRVDVHESYAYVAAGDAGLRIINVANPYAPFEVGYFDTPRDARGVAAVKTDMETPADHVIVADGDGLRMIDVSNPVKPSEAGFIATPGLAGDVIVPGPGPSSYAYLTLADQGVQIVEVDDVEAPTLAGFIASPGQAHKLAVAGQRLYLADGAADLRVIDVSDPSAPFEIDFVDVPGDVLDVAVAGNKAYLAAGQEGLRIIDLIDQVELGFTDEFMYVYDKAPVGNYVYVANYGFSGGGLLIYDVSNPAAPTEAGNHDLGYESCGIDVVGNYAYLAAVGLYVFDVSNPNTPLLTGSIRTPYYAHDVTVRGRYAYVGDADYGLRVFDVANPLDPTEIGFVSTRPGWAVRLAIVGHYAYVANYLGGLQIIDISDPAKLIPVGSHATPREAVAVAVAENHAYVAVRKTGLQIFDVADPRQPTLLTTYYANANDVFVSGDYAFITDGWGVKMLDISDPAAPVLVGYYKTPGPANNVDVIGNMIYVGMGHRGLIILRLIGSPTVHIPVVLR